MSRKYWVAHHEAHQRSDVRVHGISHGACARPRRRNGFGEVADDLGVGISSTAFLLLKWYWTAALETPAASEILASEVAA